MTLEESPVYNAAVICNGCGCKMKDMGIWPVQFPKADGIKYLHMAHRFNCTTCKTPNSEYEKGTPIMVSILF